MNIHQKLRARIASTIVAVGDQFLACPVCGFRLEPGQVCKPECPDCRSRMSLYTVEPQDLPEAVKFDNDRKQSNSTMNDKPDGAAVCDTDYTDAARYRKLRRWMSSNVPEGWEEVKNLGGLACYAGWEEFDGYLDALPECNVGLCEKSQGQEISPRTDEGIRPAGAGSLSAPLKGTTRMIRDVPLQAGDWAVAGIGDGALLRVHPNLYGKMASNPAYSYFRPKD